MQIPPSEAKAQVISERIPGPRGPSLDELRKAHRRMQKRDRGDDFQQDAVLGWLEYVTARKEAKPGEFHCIPLHCEASWLPLSFVAQHAADFKPPEGTTLLVYGTMEAMLRKILVDHGGHRGAQRITVNLGTS